MKRILNLVIATFIVNLPLIVFAQGVVPCAGANCDFCEFAQMVNNLVQYALFYLILPACVIALIMAGILLLTAAGSPQKIDKGKDIFKYALFGLCLAFIAFLIIQTILAQLVEPGYIPVQNGLNFPGC